MSLLIIELKVVEREGCVSAVLLVHHKLKPVLMHLRDGQTTESTCTPGTSYVPLP